MATSISVTGGHLGRSNNLFFEKSYSFLHSYANVTIQKKVTLYPAVWTCTEHKIRDKKLKDWHQRFFHKLLKTNQVRFKYILYTYINTLKINTQAINWTSYSPFSVISWIHVQIFNLQTVVGIALLNTSRNNFPCSSLLSFSLLQKKSTVYKYT